MRARTVITKALQGNYAVGAFNASNIETLKAVTQAAAKLRSPIIIEASDGEISYIGYKQLVSLVRIYEAELGIPIVLNLDHGKDLDACVKAIEAGFDYIHIDTGKYSYEDAVNVTCEVVKLAHKHDLLVEGEIDHIEGSSADHRDTDPSKIQNSNQYTDPDRAFDFVQRTRVDVFASFIGNLHGIYASTKHLNLDILHKIRQKMPDTYLSLHGGSGIFENDVREAVKCGVVKVNVNSEMRIAYKLTLQNVLNSSNEIAAYKFNEKPVEEVRKVVEQKIKLFGSEGKI